MISIDTQVAALERACVNKRGRIERCKELAAKGRWPETDIDMQPAHLGQLQQGLETLRMLARHWDLFETAVMEASK